MKVRMSITIKYNPLKSDTVIYHMHDHVVKKGEFIDMMKKIYDGMKEGVVDWIWVQKY